VLHILVGLPDYPALVVGKRKGQRCHKLFGQLGIKRYGERVFTHAFLFVQHARKTQLKYFLKP
jgi:hypothetical protein